MAAAVAAAGAGQAQPVQAAGLHLQHRDALSALEVKSFIEASWIVNCMQQVWKQHATRLIVP